MNRLIILLTFLTFRIDSRTESASYKLLIILDNHLLEKSLLMIKKLIVKSVANSNRQISFLKDFWRWKDLNKLFLVHLESRGVLFALIIL